MLRIEHATKTFLPGTPNAHLALRDINLHLAPGEFITLIGTNGAGKSTLLNAISGDFLLDEGRILLDGQDITYLREYKRAALVGRLFQDPMKGTAPGMTVEENLALAYSRSHRRSLQLALRRQDSELFRQRLAEFGLGLENRMKTKMGLLSGGQRQAVTLLMSTISTPKLLLLDEHTAALDPATAEKVLEITRQIVKRDHLTAMMITHNIHSALQMGSRTIMLDDGQIILDIQGKEREEMTVERLLKMYSQKREKELDSDRMLFSK